MDWFGWIPTTASWLALVVVGAAAVDCVFGWRRLPRLAEFPTEPPEEGFPGVSVIIAARNEETELRRALDSVLRLDYPDLEVIAVNDRSEDSTGRILDEMAVLQPNLKVVHVLDLPAGWLGKNHALREGSRLARGRYLLFTDADVVFEPTALRRAMRCAINQGLDHLAGFPRVLARGAALQTVVTVFSVYFSLFFRPWKASDPRSSAHIGVGAFNLVRAEAYRRCGGHEPIRMRPDDDVRLGRLLKRHGYRQAAAWGGDLIQVEWYRSVGQLIRGLMKNTFAGLDYRLWMAVGGTLGQVLFSLWPFAGLLAVGGWTRLANLATVAALLWLYRVAARQNGVPAWHGIAFPLAGLLLLFILWKSALGTLIRGGIRWRGTFYDLDELRKRTDG